MGALVLAISLPPSPAAAANPNEMSPVYERVAAQLGRLASSKQGKNNTHRLSGTYNKSYVGRYDPAGDHIQGLAELGDRRLAVAHNGGFGKPGFLVISTGAANANAQSGTTFINMTSKHPSGMQAAGNLIAVAESEPNRVEIVDARNPNSPVLLPDATSGIDDDDVPGTLSSVGLAYDRTRELYWLLMAGSQRSMLCMSDTDSLTDTGGEPVGWDCDGVNTSSSRLKTAEGGTQLIFDADGRLLSTAFESMSSGVQRVHLSELTDFARCVDNGYVCASHTYLGGYDVRKVPTQAHPGPNFRWGATMRMGRSISITSAPRALHGGPARPYIVMLDRYWD